MKQKVSCVNGEKTGLHVGSIEHTGENTRVTVRWLGVTTLLFDDGTDQLMVDGMVTRPSLPRMLFGALETDETLVERVIQECGIDRLRAIFVTHTHYDHVMDVAAFARLTGAHVYGSRSTLNVERGQHGEEKSLHEFRAGEEYTIGGFTVRVIRSLHSPALPINNDLGKEVLQPIRPHPHRRDYAEGGSYDLLITHHGRGCLVKPSCNFIPGALDNIQADLFFLSTGQMDRIPAERKEEMYRNTILKVQPETVVPIHWDDIFAPYDRGSKPLPRPFDNFAASKAFLSEKLGHDGIALKILPIMGAIGF